jgi:6-phosphogluconolactonase
MNEGLMVYSVDANSGALTQMWSSPFCSQHCPPDDMLMGGTSDPSGRFLYAQAQNGIYGYAVDRETGAPTAVPGSPFPAGSNGGFAGNILTTDDRGRFLYATDVSGNQIYAFRIDQQSGALTPIPGSPYATGQMPLTVAFQGSNNFLYVGNLNSGDISAYAVHADGSLVSVKGSPFSVGSYPFFLLPDQTGDYLYVSIVNGTTASIASCRINRASGSLQSCKPFTRLGGYFTLVTP